MADRAWQASLQSREGAEPGTARSASFDRLWLSICGPYPLVACALNVAGLAMAMRDQMVILAVASAGRRSGAAGRGDDLGRVVSVTAYMPLPYARIRT